MGRHRTGPRIAVGIVSAAVLAGCAFDRPLPTHDGTLDSGTGFEGILRLDGECVWVDSIDFDRMALNVVWPAGYNWRGPPLEVIDRTGAVIAREGDLVSFGIVDHKRGSLAPARSVTPPWRQRSGRSTAKTGSARQRGQTGRSFASAGDT